jgi:hypothetical protein
MNFTVIWTALAQEQLADIWLVSANRTAVALAQHQIDQLLRIDPDTRGVPFFGDRLLYIPPLRAAFSINWMDMIVEVFDVW